MQRLHNCIDSRGATLIEYALICAIFVLVFAVAIGAFETRSRAHISSVNESQPFNHDTKPLLSS